jgi:DHA2 family multidrug resistance protein
MMSMIRNMSQSAGISMMQALLTRDTQAMHSALAAHVIPSDPVIAAALTPLTNPASPAGATALDAEINRQASMVAYVDDFKLMMVLAMICMPMLLLMRPPRRSGGEALNAAGR